MEIQFFKITDAPEVMRKTLGTPHTVQGTCRDELDMFSPVIMLGFDCSEYNYMFIPELSRYYYINGCVAVTGELFRITGVHEDVLMSHSEALDNVMVIIDKTEMPGVCNEYIQDGSFVTSSQTTGQIYQFEDGFNDNPDFILLTAGGWLGGA